MAAQNRHINVVMLAGDAPEMQIDRPSAGEVEGRAQVPERFGYLK